MQRSDCHLTVWVVLECEFTLRIDIYHFKVNPDQRSNDKAMDVSVGAMVVSDSIIRFEEPIAFDELEELKLILDNNESPVVLIQEPRGHSRCEKIKSLVHNEYKTRACWFNCLEIFNFSQLFGTVLNKMLRPQLDLDELSEYNKNVLENMCVDKELNFIAKVESNLKKIKHKNQIVVLENADQLAKSNKEFILFLAKINQLVRGLKFTSVLISSLKEDHFKKLGVWLNEVYLIEYAPYTEKQIKSLIIDQKPDAFPIGEYKK